MAARASAKKSMLGKQGQYRAQDAPAEESRAERGRSRPKLGSGKTWHRVAAAVSNDTNQYHQTERKERKSHETRKD
jgi:hypothetical protein